MSFVNSSKVRSVLFVTCIFSLASFGACDNAQAQKPVSPATAYKGRAPIIRQQIDVTRNRVWILALDGVHVYNQGTGKKVGSAVLPGWSWVGEPYGCSPALAIGPEGEAVITSDVFPVVWRIDPATLAVTSTALALDTDADKDMGFSGLIYAPAQGAFFAAGTFSGSFWRIDPALKTAKKIALSTRLPRTCGWNIAPPEPGGGMDRGLKLCISSARGARQIKLAPDLQSAEVLAQTCTGSN
jgi:hypothetical protein